MRFFTLAVAVLAAQVAYAAPPATSPPKPHVMVVQVDAAAGGGTEVEAWARELRTALAARKDEFRLAKRGEKAELTVRIDSVAKGEGDTHSMNGALAMGKTTKPFNLTYPGEVGPQAQALARNLRKLADQMKTGSH
jgi:hypothetical protein